MDFDCLLRFRDVVPMSVSLPPIGYDLYEDASERRIGDMCDARLIGLHVYFKLFVL